VKLTADLQSGTEVKKARSCSFFPPYALALRGGPGRNEVLRGKVDSLSFIPEMKTFVIKSGMKAKLWRLVTATVMEQSFILAMFCSSRRELSFPEYGGSKLLRNAPIPNYANTWHHIPDAVTKIMTTAFTVFASIPYSITVPYFSCRLFCYSYHFVSEHYVTES